MIISEKNLNDTEAVVDRMIAEGEKKEKILEKLVHLAQEFIQKDEVCSILLLDKEGLLRNGASPGLPKDYLAAIDRLKPHPKIGTCAAAAATGQMVITQDFYADDRWSELRHLPLTLGYLGAWSNPIKGKKGEVLGTFGTYFKSQRVPSQEEINLIRKLSGLAAKVVEHFKERSK